MKLNQHFLTLNTRLASNCIVALDSEKLKFILYLTYIVKFRYYLYCVVNIKYSI